MPIKVGFSSMVCPGWDFATIVQQAGSLGYDGVELRSLAGRLHLPEVPELADSPGTIRALTGEAGVELVCLGSSASFEDPNPKAAQENRRQLTETIELAGKLRCSYVRIFLGSAVVGEHRRSLSRVASELAALAPLAARHGATILVENGGDFTASEDLWFIIDSVSHPAVRGCWNPLNGRLRGERPTTSVPRLGGKIEMFRIADGRFDGNGRFAGYEVPGAGDVELARAIELLKGVCFQGWLMFEWPRLIAELPEPEVVLPKVLEFVRGRLAETQPVLSAYKRDKHRPNFQAPPAVQTTSDK